MTSNLKDLIYFAEVDGSLLTLSVEGVKELKQDLERLEETEKALVETYELNASLRKQVEELEANLKHLNINYKTALKVNNDLLNENRKLKEEYYDLEGELANTHYKMVRYKKAIEILKKNHEIVLHYDDEFPTPMISINGVYSYINKQEYELLKEVLENDTSDNIK